MRKEIDESNPSKLKLKDNSLRSSKCYLSIYDGFMLEGYSNITIDESQSWILSTAPQHMACAKCMKQLSAPFFFCNQFEIMFCTDCDNDVKPSCVSLQDNHEHFYIEKVTDTILPSKKCSECNKIFFHGKEESNSECMKCRIKQIRIKR